MTQHSSFQSVFNQQLEGNMFSPGRVNLIGEHTDYSGGVVLPMALSIGIKGSYKKNNEQCIKAYSTSFPKLGILTIDFNDIVYKRDLSFGNYLQGALYVLKEEGYKITQGFDIFMDSTLPKSAGLSSSAALEMLVLTIIRSVNNLDIEDSMLVRYAKKIENDFMNVSSGIMDQYAVAFAKKNHALFLNTESLIHEHAPLNMDDYRLVMMNTNKDRDLENSDYNERFESVASGQEILTSLSGKASLGELSVETFNQYKEHINNPIVRKRIKHVIHENKRTTDAYHALRHQDYKTFGNLMKLSHISLRDDFEVSCAELDYLVEENLALGAIGSRMTGAGFGGTMIALYHIDDLPKSFEKLKSNYRKKFNRQLDVYIAKSSDGVLIKE